MRSPAESRTARVALEWVLRAVALAALLALLWRATRPPIAASRVRTVAPATIDRWRDSTVAGDTLRLVLDGAPAAAARDQIAALAGAGRTVQWSDDGVPALAATVEPPRAPDGAPTLLAVAPAGGAVALGDEAGTLDSVRATARAAALAIPGAGRGLRARTGATEARAAVRESVEVRRVLVLGRAGWEAKFTIAALEEAGWRVDAEVGVAPGARVVQAMGDGAAAPLPDTARHAAVVLLDSSAASPASRAAAIVAYVRAGGGAVLAGDAALAPALAALRAGAAGVRRPGEAGALAASDPRRGLPWRGVATGPDMVPLERRGGLVAAGARRIGAGRVVQLGYEDSWRWRMEGDDPAPAEHRRWWSAVVASVARAPVVARHATAPGAVDPAPRAALVAALGPPVAATAALPPARGARLPDSLLLAAALLALLGEWASRRLRGAP